MYFLTDLQAATTLGTDDQTILRQGTTDKRIELSLAAAVAWGKRKGYTFLGEYEAGMSFPDYTSFAYHQGKTYTVLGNLPAGLLPYQPDETDPSSDYWLTAKRIEDIVHNLDEIRDYPLENFANKATVYLAWPVGKRSGRFSWIPENLATEAFEDSALYGVYIPSNHYSSAAGCWVRNREEIQSIYPEWWGAQGDDTDDDLASLEAAITFANKTGGTVDLRGNKYYISAPLETALTNTKLVGSRGSAAIRVNPVYSQVMKLLEVSNSTIEGIEFVTEKVSSTAATSTAVLYSSQNNVADLYINGCTFTSTAVNTFGFAIYARYDASDTSGSISNVHITDCDFNGYSGAYFSNKNNSTPEAATGVHFNNNRNNGVLVDGTEFLRLEGVGSVFTVNDNLLRNNKGSGISNTGWSDGEIRFNKFDGNDQADFIPLNIGSTVWTAMKRLVVEGNALVGEQTSAKVYIDGVEDSRFIGNIWRAGAGAACAIEYAYCKNNTFNNDTYIEQVEAGGSALVGLNADGNTFTDCTFNNASGLAAAPLVFYGSDNRVYNAKFKGELVAGVYATQATGDGNAILSFTEEDGIYDTASLHKEQILSTTHTVTGTGALFVYDFIKFYETYAYTSCVVTFPREMFLKPKTLISDVSGTLTFIVNGNTSTSWDLLAGESKTYVYDPELDTVVGF